jgi:hypothetical protein
MAAIPMTQTTSKKAIAGKEKDDTIAATPIPPIISDELLIIRGMR